MIQTNAKAVPQPQIVCSDRSTKDKIMRVLFTSSILILFSTQLTSQWQRIPEMQWVINETYLGNDSVIWGWTNYHKGICAKLTFYKLGSFIFRQLRRWAKYQHGNKNIRWIYRRYFLNTHFTDSRTSDKGIDVYRLYRIGHVPIRYHVKIRSLANPYLPEYDKYFFQRRACRDLLAKECKQITTFSGKETNVNRRVSSHGVCLKSA